ncbi:DEAD/DEAH box helicase [Paenibacillus koleovorans]|uniref:DEAD/DEAH box helicase n=1 Tax=Paenibacillus koleovorans TaxID=121608 RepID=UPI000FDCC9CF|nr:DEAD/DEAH box helicase [Paenibacillus koleovorans]
MQWGAIPSKEDILDACGSTSYSRGLSYYRSGRVLSLSYDPLADRYSGMVQGSKKYGVSVLIDEYGEVTDADCSCLAFGSYDYCKHVAALLLQIESHGKSVGSSGRSASSAVAPQPPKQSRSPAISERDAVLARNVLALFDRHREESSASASGAALLPQTSPVAVEFICHLSSGPRSMAAVELKVGTVRLYVVQKIKDFLDKLANGKPVGFGKNFTFDPTVHRFQPDDAEIMKVIQDTYNNEKLYREMNSSSYGYRYGYRNQEDRALHLPPAAWASILPSLLKTRSRFLVDGRELGQVMLQEGGIPLHFELGQGPIEGSYRLDLKGISKLVVLSRYELAIGADGEMYRMDKLRLERLSELKNTLAASNDGKVTIPPAQTEAFLQRVVPALKRLGSFSVDKVIADRLVSEPLRAKVYLDRQNDELVAKVAFAYGDVEIWPLGRNGREQEDQASKRIVMRDGEREYLVLSMLREADFIQRGEQFRIASEESEYRFLFHGLTQLQQMADVYATHAVDASKSGTRSSPKATVDVDSQMNWLEVKFELEGVSDKELLLLLRSLSEKRKYYRLANGAFVSLEEEAYMEIGRLFEELNVRKSDLKSGKLQLPVVRGLSLAGQEGTGHAAVKHGKSLRRLLDNLRNPDNVDAEPPSSLAPVLRDYQKYGFQWMKTLGMYGFGGILADDMGLGKTLQSISYIASEREQRDFAGAPVLIVCPASLVFNWRNELAKFSPQLKVAVAAGSKAERDALLEQALEVDVLITSYPLFRRDVDWYGDKHFHALILDEAQAIKNNVTQTAQAIKTISAGQRFALTGTPVENRLEELWSIYDAVFPDLFGGRKAFQDLSPEQVARKVKPFLLRRLKKDVLKELPDKIETLQSSELLPEQKKLYMAYLLQLQNETAQHLETEGFQKSRLKILAGLTRLRQLCCHPSLFLDNYTGDSGKMEQLFELIDECLGSGKRMLIFSQFTGMLGLIREELGRRGLTYFYLDGTTKSAERVELCTRFNEGENDIFLISLKAGGTGLNLTGADTVILCDLWWNPAVEQQAADRAHRIGQKNVVQVIRLMTEGTIEEKMYELQQRKKDLIDTVIQPGEEALSALTEADIRELLAL